MVPDEWQTGRIGDLISRLDAGVSVNAEDRRITDGEVGVLKVSAVSYGTFRPEEHKTVLAEEMRRVSVSPKRDRILISRANSPELVGASVYIDRDYPSLYLPDKIWQAEPVDGSFSMRWLNYVLSSGACRSAISKLATGTSNSMKNIAKQDFLNIRIVIPPVQWQRHIINVLAMWDRAIDITTQLIGEKLQRKRGLMQQLLTGNRRLPAFKASTWTKRRLGDLFIERRETHRGDLPLLSITNKEGVVPRESVERRDTSNEDKSLYLRICPGDIGYNTMRMWQGVSGVSDLEGIVSPAYTICVPQDGADARFMGYLFKLPSMIHRFQRYSQGLVDDTLSLKFDVFSKIEVSVPAIDDQRAIAQVLTACDYEIDLLGQQLELLKQQKQGLMQQLLTGKGRVAA